MRTPPLLLCDPGAHHCPLLSPQLSQAASRLHRMQWAFHEVRHTSLARRRGISLPTRAGCPGPGVKLTVQLLLDLQCDRLPSHLQEADGLTQWSALEAHTVDGQDTVPDMERASPEEGHRARIMGVRHSGLQNGALPSGKSGTPWHNPS